MSAFDAAVSKAIQKLTPRRAGATVGSSLIGSAVIGYVYDRLVRRPVKDRHGNVSNLDVSKACDICHHDVHGVNADGHGKVIAAIYEDDAGRLHKKVGDSWYYWDGADWV